MRRPTPSTTLPLFLLPSLCTAVSLATFQTISTDNAACLKAYKTTIPNCAAADFIDGAACTEACIKSLTATQTRVANACRGITGPPDTLLSSLLSGNMVVALCPNVMTTVTLVGTITVAPGSTESSKPTSVVTTPKASSVQSTKASSTPKATTTGAPSSTSSADDSTSSSSAADSSSTSSPPITSTASIIPTIMTSTTPSFTTSTLSSTALSSSLAPSSTAPSPNPGSLGGQTGTGGGSPFQVASGAAASAPSSRMGSAVLSVMAAVWVMAGWL